MKTCNTRKACPNCGGASKVQASACKACGHIFITVRNSPTLEAYQEFLERQFREQSDQASAQTIVGIVGDRVTPETPTVVTRGKNVAARRRGIAPGARPTSPAPLASRLANAVCNSGAGVWVAACMVAQFSDFDLNAHLFLVLGLLLLGAIALTLRSVVRGEVPGVLGWLGVFLVKLIVVLLVLLVCDIAGLAWFLIGHAHSTG